jgi:importin subunit beta-1
LVAAIAAIEIPRNEWLDLVQLLCSNSQHTDAQVKLTSLQTLGFICEELEPEHLSAQLKNQIIHCLTTTINKNEGNNFPSTVIASKALLKSIEFADNNFKVPQERDFIMNKVFEGLECQHVQVREAAMQTLVELAHLQYDSIEFYLKQIALVTA